jgi:hypothetical protein
MLDLRTQSQLVDATATILRACLAATTNTWAASAYRGLSLWAEVLGAASRPGTTAWAAHSLDCTAWGRAWARGWNGQIDARARLPAAATQSALPLSFSSYRSDGGHAVAQIASG